MTEAVETQVLFKSALHPIHQQLGATLVERDGWLVPQSYGDVLFEYAAVRENGCGVIDLSSRGRIMVTGSEAVQFLNGLITNDMKTLAENTWMPAAFPNVQGRLIASVRVIRLPDQTTDKNVDPVFMLDTETLTHEKVLKTIERFTLAGDFRVTDVTGETVQLSVQGKNAVDVVRAVLGDESANLAAFAAKQSEWQQTKVIVNRTTETGDAGFDLIVNANQAAGLWHALVQAGARPVGHEALEIMRIEVGIPRYGVDMDETNVVSEVLEDAVSYSKGCYVGQEIVARIKYRGHVAKKLSGLAFAQAERVEAGALIKSADGKEVGRITSPTYSPHLGYTIALGYLKYDYTTLGTSVKIRGGEEEVGAQVVQLPFVRGMIHSCRA